MFSTAVQQAIAKTAFKTLDNYVEALSKVGVPFTAPIGNTIDVNNGDTVQSIMEKIKLVSTDRHELWFNGIIVDTKGKIDPRLTEYTLTAIKELQTAGDLPVEVMATLNGLKNVPVDGLHPKTVEAIVRGHIQVPQNYRYYDKDQKMAEICFIMRKDAQSTGYGMACGFSNFNNYPKGPVTLENYGVQIDPTSWMHYINIAEINATEKIIQIMKVAAGAGNTFRCTDPEKIREKLAARLDLIRKECPECELAKRDISAALALETPQLIELNDAISKQLMDIMIKCFDPKVQKALGRNALIGNANYFKKMDGKPFNSDAPNYEELGVNAMFMALGTMIRVDQEDEQIVSLMKLCKLLNIQFNEAAVHCSLDMTIEKNKVDVTFGCEPDLPWGSCADYPRQSPDFFKVVAYSEVTNANKETTLVPRKINGAFGAGISLLAAACNNEGELGRAARRRLGVSEDVLMVVNRESIRAVAQNMLRQIG